MPTNPTQSSHELHDFFRQASSELLAEYIRVQKRATEDPGTAGDEGEANWAAILEAWLPPTYRVVTKGRLLGEDGSASPQMDVIVLKPAYPRGLSSKKLYLAGGVAAAFECKLTLKAQHVRDAFASAAWIHQAFSRRSGSPYLELTNPIVFGLLAHSHSWQKPNSDPVANIQNVVSECVLAAKHPRDMLDIICVADLGAWIAHRTTWMGPQIFPEWEEPFPTLYGTQGSCLTSLVAHYRDYEHQEETFNPLSTTITSIFCWRRLNTGHSTD